MDYKVQLDNDDHYVGGNTHQYIVVHDTGNLTDSDEGNANHFCSGTRNSSAHKFVDDDSVTTLVKDDDCSFHCGDGHGAYGITNRNSLGVEMCRRNGTVSTRTEDNTLLVVRAWMDKYGIPIERVVRHYDASRKCCPASFGDNGWARWWAFKSKLAGTTVVACASGGVGSHGVYDPKGIMALQYAINKACGWNLDIDGDVGPLTDAAIDKIFIRRGDRGPIVGWIQSRLGICTDYEYGNAPYHETYDAICKFQMDHNLDVDGVVGPMTLRAMIQ